MAPPRQGRRGRGRGERLGDALVTLARTIGTPLSRDTNMEDEAGVHKEACRGPAGGGGDDQAKHPRQIALSGERQGADGSAAGVAQRRCVQHLVGPVPVVLPAGVLLVTVAPGGAFIIGRALRATP